MDDRMATIWGDLIILLQSPLISWSSLRMGLFWRGRMKDVSIVSFIGTSIPYFPLPISLSFSALIFFLLFGSYFSINGRYSRH